MNKFALACAISLLATVAQANPLDDYNKVYDDAIMFAGVVAKAIPCHVLPMEILDRNFDTQKQRVYAAWKDITQKNPGIVARDPTGPLTDAMVAAQIQGAQTVQKMGCDWWRQNPELTWRLQSAFGYTP